MTLRRSNFRGTLPFTTLTALSTVMLFAACDDPIVTPEPTSTSSGTVTVTTVTTVSSVSSSSAGGSGGAGGEGGAGEGGAGEGGAGGAGGGCATGQELCGEVCVDTATDVANCGSCGNACAEPTNGTAACADGKCVVASCTTGFADCNASFDDGCEVDTQADGQNCGACGNACLTPMDGMAACTMGSCTLASCNTGFADCDMTLDNGCEINTTNDLANCGACGNACTKPANGSPSCVTGSCGIDACDTGFADCDSMVGTGCEINTTNDVKNCGACGNACAKPANGTAQCATSACAVDTCDMGFADCDKAFANGCEITTTNDVKNCGACGNACAADQVCKDSKCEKPAVVTTIATGFEHSCVKMPNGTAKCWGDGASGELGDASNILKTSPVDVKDATGYVSIAAGLSFGCAVKGDGTVWCWGSNAFGGKLGDGTGVNSNVAVQATDVTSAELVSTGRGHACASTRNKEVFCWGTNALGQLGDPALATSNKPAKIPAGLPAERAISIAAGGFHTCAAFEGGKVFCWGRNDFGQVGVTVSQKETSPREVTLPKAAEQVVAGDLFTCARLVDKSVTCWGAGVSGQLGNGASVNTATPVPVSGIATAIDLGAGFEHVCAVLADKTVACWGANGNNQLGNGGPNSNVPVAVAGLMDAVQVEGGNVHSCAILTAGGVRCWGANGKGQLGNGTTTPSATPVIPTGLD
jgi:alpha-tubulin suppressor-like RCC1 family protein